MSDGPSRPGVRSRDRTRSAPPAKALAKTSALDDAGLLARMSDGDAAALAEFYDRHAGRAFSLAQAICRDAGRAEDAVQEAFLSVWRSPGGYRVQLGAPTTWLMAIVRNRAIDGLRRDAARCGNNASADELERLASSEDVSAQVATRMEAGELRGLMTRLPAEQREVITLAYFGGLTHSQIATHLGLPSGTVKGRIRLGLEKLRMHAEPA